MQSRAMAGPPVVDVPAIYRSHWLSMVRLAALLTGDRSVAEDVTQDAFVALYRNQQRLVDPGAAVGYLRAAVVNGARSAVRRRMVARRRSPSLRMLPVAAADDQVMLAEEHLHVLRALHTLPERQREVLVLRFWAEVSEAEIAGLLGISPGTVKSSASRGIAALRRAMESGDEQ